MAKVITFLTNERYIGENRMAKTNNCVISLEYIQHYDPIDKNESKDLFGEEHIEEFGHNVPEELLEKHKKNLKEFKGIQKEIRKYYSRK